MLICGLKKEALTLIFQSLGKIQIKFMKFMPYKIMLEKNKSTSPRCIKK